MINQNLLAHNIPLPDEYEQSKIYGTATLFLTYAMISFILFTIIVLLEAIGEKHNILKNARYIFESLVFIFFLLPIVTAIRTQRYFNLRAVI